MAERPHYWRLDDAGHPQPVDDILQMMSWADEGRITDRTEIGDVLISTVFLMIDHNFTGMGPPVLWETMVFGGKLDGEQERYTSVEAALAGHDQWVRLVRQSLAEEA